jgi:hypothetical protein
MDPRSARYGGFYLCVPLTFRERLGAEQHLKLEAEEDLR